MVKMKKRLLAGAAICCLAAAAMFPLSPFNSRAAEGLVTWQPAANKGDKKSVKMILQLDEDEIFEESATFQIGLLLDPGPDGEINECEFKFKKGVMRSSSDNMVIQEMHYDEEEHELLLVVAGRKDKDGNGGALNKEKALELGTLYVSSDVDVKVSLIGDKCLAVDESGVQQNFSCLGAGGKDSFVLKAEESPEPETDPPSDNYGGGHGSSSGRKPTPPTANPGPGDPIETKGRWEPIGGIWQFKKENGVYAQNEWLLVNGLWYRVGEAGAMVTGWFQFEGKWYYLKGSGEMATGWQQVENWWYHLGIAGEMDTGWKEVDGKWYLLNDVPPTPRQVMDPATGQMVESIEGQMPYGAMYAGCTTPDGHVVDENGAMTP